MSHLISKIESFVMSPFGLLIITVGGTMLWLAYRALVFITLPLFSPLRKINGPPRDSFILGNFANLVNGNGFKSLRAFNEQYGHVFVIRALFGVCLFDSCIYDPI